MNETVEQQQRTPEPDSRFPSGPWTGFFLQPRRPPGKHWMALQLTFSECSMRGEGRDLIGRFIITGRYSVEDGKCRWTKKYLGQHDVHYEGYNEGRGIWGFWFIPPSFRGGFHIWPEAMGDPSIDVLHEESDEPLFVEVAE